MSFLQAELGFSVPKGDASSQDQNDSFTPIPPLPECLEVSNADIVLRSSDSTNFRVHKSTLVSSSQFFRDMFLLPQPPNNDEVVDGLPVVRLSEDAEIVRALITFLYPIPPEIPVSYERVLALLGTAQKYDMSAVQSSIRAEVIHRKLPALAGSRAFRAYSVGFSNKLSPETESIARLTLDYPLTFEVLGSDLLLFEGSALSKLASFRKLCRDSVVSCLESFLDVRSGPSKIWVGCPRSKVHLLQSPPAARPTFGFGQLKPEQSLAISPSIFTFGSIPTDNDEPTLPSWLHDLFTQEIRELTRYFTRSLIKPSSIREKYLAALLKHSPNQHDCPACLMVHARHGERYCVELEQKLTQARNQVTVTSSSVHVSAVD